MDFNKLSLLIIVFQFSSLFGMSQTFYPLYPDTIPNSKPGPDQEKSAVQGGILIISKVSRPGLTVYKPNNGLKKSTAIIICPGGGYFVEAAGHEGEDVAKKFTEWGYTAIVLKYRIPNDSTMVNKEFGPLQDAQRALQWARENADLLNIQKNKIGIMGFSAGGHLASTAGTHFENAYISNPKNTSLRPDFMILVYPVISLTDSLGHRGSRDNLLGKSPSPEKILEYSNEFQVKSNTPPAYLVTAKDDFINFHNSTLFHEALKKNGIASEIYLYEKGGHGYGMNNKTSSVKWMDLVYKWMEKMDFI